MAILYHVSCNMEHDGVFVPRVPNNCMKFDENNGMFDEDNTIPRVCFSSTIEGCLGSMPSGGSRFDDTNEKRLGYYKVFFIDTDIMCNLNVLNSSELLSRKLVPDSLVYDEFWILDQFVVPKENIMYIKVLSYECFQTDIGSWEDVQESSRLGIDLFDYYREQGRISPESVFRVDDLYYVPSKVCKGQPVKFYSDLEDEEEFIIDSISRSHICEVSNDEWGDASVVFGEDANLSNLFKEAYYRFSESGKTEAKLKNQANLAVKTLNLF